MTRREKLNLAWAEELIEVLLDRVLADNDAKLEASQAALAEQLEARARDAAEIKRMRDALDTFEQRTHALPLGHENRTNGASSYNWRMACLDEIRAALFAPTDGDEE